MWWQLEQAFAAPVSSLCPELLHWCTGLTLVHRAGLLLQFAKPDGRCGCWIIMITYKICYVRLKIYIRSVTTLHPSDLSNINVSHSDVKTLYYLYTHVVPNCVWHTVFCQPHAQALSSCRQLLATVMYLQDKMYQHYCSQFWRFWWDTTSWFNLQIIYLM